MQSYTKTNWVVDVTKVNPTNMNKIENQLETLTNDAIAKESDIGDIEDNVGDLTELDTTDKTSLVNAINEVANSSSGGGEVTGIHSEKYSTLSYGNTVKTHTYFFDEGYGTSGNFISHGTDFLEKAYNDMAQYFDTSASENILQIFGKDNDGFYVLDIRLSSLTSSGTCYGKAVVITYQQMIRQQIKFNITLTDGVYKVSSLMNNGETMLLALTTQNATSYTPTASTHPATKGYVDTEISNALGTIETTLGGI